MRQQCWVRSCKPDPWSKYLRRQWNISSRTWTKSRTFPLHAYGRKRPFCVLHTSGSTEIPKPVFITYGTFACNDAHQLIPKLGGKPTLMNFLKGKRYSQSVGSSLICKGCRAVSQEPIKVINLILVVSACRLLRVEINEGASNAPSRLPCVKTWFARSAVNGSGGGMTEITPAKILYPIVNVRHAAWNNGSARKDLEPHWFRDDRLESIPQAFGCEEIHVERQRSKTITFVQCKFLHLIMQVGWWNASISIPE